MTTPTTPLVALLFAYAAEHHPRAMRGLHEARAVDPDRFDVITQRLLGWAQGVLGERLFERAMGAFTRFSEGVALSQARYERDGRYENSSYAEMNARLYGQRQEMDDYLWGVYLTNTLWAHHMDLTLFYLDRFVARLPPSAHIVELAPGHGGWGLLALERRPLARLEGFDISPSSLAIASALAAQAGFEGRASYAVEDALALVNGPAARASHCVCNFLVEHLETPARLLASMAHVLAPGGRAFFSGALTAAQVDHIYEFKLESELVLLAEAAGFRVLESLSVTPQRALKRARYAPRSMSLILQKKTHETF
ncbi:methyltransferase domain-containing protein [Myxococcota bacterium]|nr:methyltransferase domain-containing protein [Myxococcota bacterium]MBU1432776.1 methyltransferase domain-containing protein [Myxococcota bacterium]MBU1898849.1 methyltransferase domain-containing protein [Myxococcota bacterium]